MLAIAEVTFNNEPSEASWLGSMWWNLPTRVQVLDIHGCSHFFGFIPGLMALFFQW